MNNLMMYTSTFVINKNSTRALTLNRIECHYSAKDNDQLIQIVKSVLAARPFSLNTFKPNGYPVQKKIARLSKDDVSVLGDINIYITI